MWILFVFTVFVFSSTTTACSYKQIRIENDLDSRKGTSAVIFLSLTSPILYFHSFIAEFLSESIFISNHIVIPAHPDIVGIGILIMTRANSINKKLIYVL